MSHELQPVVIHGTCRRTSLSRPRPHLVIISSLLSPALTQAHTRAPSHNHDPSTVGIKSVQLSRFRAAFTPPSAPKLDSFYNVTARYCRSHHDQLDRQYRIVFSKDQAQSVLDYLELVKRTMLELATVMQEVDSMLALQEDIESGTKELVRAEGWAVKLRRHGGSISIGVSIVLVIIIIVVIAVAVIVEVG